MIHTHTFKALTAIALTTISAHAIAQDLDPAADEQSHPIFLVGATAHTVSGGIITNSVISMNEGKIGVVGKADEIMPRISLSADTQIIDLTGKHVFPGLIDSVTRLGLEETSAVRATRDYNEVGPMTPEVRAYIAVNPDSTVTPVARTNGVLTVGVFPSGGTIPGRASVMTTDGWTNEDLALARDAGMIISLSDNNTDDLNEIFDQAIAYNQSHTNSDLRMDAIGTVLPGPDQNPVFMRASSFDQITKSINWAMTYNLKPIIVGGRDAHLCTDILKSTNTPVIIGGTFGFPKRADAPYDDPYTLPAKLDAAGVQWSLTMASRFGHERNLPDAAAIAVAHGTELGFTKDAALNGITLSAAKILGVDSILGSLEPGKHATLIVADGHILETTTVVEHAFVQGKKIDLGNKQTDLRDTYREKYRQLGLIEDPSQPED
ncbi:MAG: amidohydrolase family protein [Phycisphaerales bacterium]